LTHCEFSAIPCLLLSSYTDSESPDSITLSGFRNLFDVPEIGSGLCVGQKLVQTRLKKIASIQQKDNLFV
jgi:hypothetical protein